MKALVCMGTRPEVIKLAPVIKELERKGHEVAIAAVNQQEDLLHKTMNIFGISDTREPGYSCGVPNEGTRVNNVLKASIGLCDYASSNWNPDIVIVQGDTTTALGGALAAFNNKIPVAHVEAGLRSHDMNSPFPEEMNRVVIDAITKHHYCPTDDDCSNVDWLKVVTGNTEMDSVAWALKHGHDTGIGKDAVIITMHRRENAGEPFDNVREAVIQLAADNKDREFFIVVHPNPAAQKAFLYKDYPDNVHTHHPFKFDVFVNMLAKASLIITDSGGLQEDGSFLKVPVVVARNETERMGGVTAGQAIIAGTGKKHIVDASRYALEGNWKFDDCPYGDGLAAVRIVNNLEMYYG